MQLTVLEHPVHVQTVRSARLVIRTSFQVRRQFPGPRVVDYPRIRFTYRICIQEKHGYYYYT